LNSKLLDKLIFSLELTDKRVFSEKKLIAWITLSEVVIANLEVILLFKCIGKFYAFGHNMDNKCVKLNI